MLSIASVEAFSARSIRAMRALAILVLGLAGIWRPGVSHCSASISGVRAGSWS